MRHIDATSVLAHCPNVVFFFAWLLRGASPSRHSNLANVFVYANVARATTMIFFGDEPSPSKI